MDEAVIVFASDCNDQSVVVRVEFEGTPDEFLDALKLTTTSLRFISFGKLIPIGVKQ